MSLDYEDDVLDAMFDSGVSQDKDSSVSQDKIDEAKAMLRAMMGINQPSGGPAGSTQGLTTPSLDKSFAKYKEQLSEIYGRRPRPTIYDLASTVGGAMLAADPTTLGWNWFGAIQQRTNGITRTKATRRPRHWFESL